MPPETAALATVVALALLFAYTNGFHDAANSIATSITTRALAPRVAVAMAAVMNLVGAFLGEGVARTIGANLIAPLPGTHGLLVLFAALVGAIVWNVFTWFRGIPASASQALVGGMVGAALVSASTVDWGGVVHSFVLPMALSPLAGGLLGYLLMLAIMWAFRNAAPRRLGREFRLAQSVSAAAMALGNGLQDAQKTMGVVVLALVTTGYQSSYDVPGWVVVAAAVAMSLGTATGGWRIMRTLGRRVIHLDPARGFAAEATVSVITYATSFVWQVPISSTHTVTAAIVGVGATRRLSAVRWGVAGDIVLIWLLTVPGSAAVAAGVYLLCATAYPPALALLGP
ncbi:inorganic phosphate transporter [Marinitenerispora sediminis]|uniref:Anion permease n=1 Tax=Marinitenerispora sediminis TaxID=1931232 RepID=A0A368T3J5_9ACTN|nr:inorganic phosphate transporter [Marinitenerispora sediminis]RCV53002.1 anion permease [Marinitenerispora sediminis]RCV57205.1 anion permease [Marinitenerispora sediminis]RCV57248.1 anion permease [Marinitenerispora sediminis]